MAVTFLLCPHKCRFPSNVMKHHWPLNFIYTHPHTPHVLHVLFRIYFYLLLLWSHPVRTGDAQFISARSYWGKSCSAPPFSSECLTNQCMRCVSTFWKYFRLDICNKVPGFWNLLAWLFWNSTNTMSLTHVLPHISPCHFSRQLKITSRLDYKSLFEQGKGNAMNSFELLKVNTNFADVYFLST